MDKMTAYKGIAPGAIISRFLMKSGRSQRDLAEKTGIHYQTINALISGKRAMTISQSLELDKALGFDRGFLAIIQTYYQINQTLSSAESLGQPPSIRDCVFWDINPSTLDWNRHKDFILARVHERGNKKEIDATEKYYRQ